MSVVVCINDGEKLWLACDSQATKGHSKLTLNHPNNWKIFKHPVQSDFMVGVVGDLRLQNLMKVIPFIADELTYLKDEVDFEYVVTGIVPMLIDYFNQMGNGGVVGDIKLKNEPFFNGTILLTYKNNMFTIDPFGTVIEHVDYVAIGSGEVSSYGYLDLIGDFKEIENKSEIVIKAIESACVRDLYVGFPIIVINSEDNEYIIQV